ncbi:MAG: tRNA glutamyl-Q(34) synthetase GluQRS, partial [Candidatus Obscuribacterales bacterium]|nr:tRNA glutamyl-Q(34) synthetase GluQRS [Steroidobacteraceae bacterium]
MSPHRGRYIGRFAPSPTGPLHFGSLVAAVGSYLDARHVKGQWRVRIEDIDTTREIPGSADLILRTLSVFGFEWDDSIERQSDRIQLYDEAFARLRECEQIFTCSCSRTEIAALQGSYTGDETRYPGVCRTGPSNSNATLATRLRVDPLLVEFADRLQGSVKENVAATVGDFVIKRRDGLYAYHFAVVVDDAAQHITDVVRGADLLDSTARQILLQRALGLPTPRYGHLPLAIDQA